MTIVQRIPPGVLGGTLVLSGSCRTGSGLLTGAAADRFRGIEEVTMIEVRPFTRGDREQLARLVNAHVAAAMPGASVPTATLLNDLERPIGEYVVGPWVTDMATLVVVEGDRIVAGAHLRRYGGGGGNKRVLPRRRGDYLAGVLARSSPSGTSTHGGGARTAGPVAGEDLLRRWHPARTWGLRGVSSRNGKNRTLSLDQRPQRPELAWLDELVLPDVVPGEVDVPPTQG